MTVLARLNQYGTLLGREFDETTANNISISGLGTFFSSEFIENIGITTTLTTRTFLTYDPVSDDFVGDSLSDALGGSKGTYMRYNTDKSVVVYEDIDEVNDYRNIVVDGLVLDLNASSSLSYPGSGTTWTDLSGNGNNGTLVNGVSYSSANGGVIIFDGVNDHVGTAKTSGDLGIFDASYTFDAWVYPTNISGSSGDQTVFGTDQTNTRLGLHLIFRNTTIYQGHFSADYSAGTASANQWQHVVWTYNKTAGTSTGLANIYKNGVKQGSGSTISSFIGTTEIFIGRWGGGAYYTGRGAQYKIYNRALNDAEVLQNYNALKSFYGL